MYTVLNTKNVRNKKETQKIKKEFILKINYNLKLINVIETIKIREN